jgi:nickel transport protein
MLLILALTLLLSASALYAHDLVIDKKGNEFVVLYGHADKGKLDVYKIDWLKEVKAYDKTGKAIDAQLKPHAQGANVAVPQDPAMITLVFDRGCMAKTPEGYKNVSKREAKNAIESWKGAVYNRNIWQWSDRFAKPLGAKFEIIPLKNPLTLKVGDSLPIQALYNGKPMEGLEMRHGGAHPDPKDQKGAITDKDGKASVTINHSGLQVVKTSLKTPLQNNPDADFLRESANLTFAVQ